jgi:16S rRNA (guanine(1405)-N(7))-methyltransferase
MNHAELLETLVNAVLASARYQHVSPDLVRRLGERELAVRRNLKEAIKATKNKLHQVGGAYFDAKVDYAQALALLQETAGDPDGLRQTCRQLMRLHASTRERLAILNEFYSQTLADLPPISSVLDIACGLNPLARPWMPFSSQVEYMANDIYADLITFIGQFMRIAGIKGVAEVRNVIDNPPTRPVDLALILKTLPILEQVDKSAVPRLLDAIQARYLLISYPVHSLGGRSKGMAQTYEASFQALAAGRKWRVQRFVFTTEVAFLVEVTALSPPS